MLFELWITIPAMFGILLVFLSTNGWFLQTMLGEYIFVTRDFYDVNQTAVAFDSTGPSNNKEQASEVFAKHTYGRVLPDLKNSQENIFVIAQPCETKRDFLITYYNHLEAKYFCFENSKTQVKMKAAHFVDDYPVARLESYLEQMTRQQFTDPFIKMFANRLRAKKSFHTFGTDMNILKDILQIYGWRHFIVTHDARNNSLYSEVLDLQYGKTFTAKEFFVLSCSHSEPFLVQEDYQYWATHGKLNECGKRAQVFFHPLKIIRWIILDDVDCWDYNTYGGKFVHVNAIDAAVSANYFTDLVTDNLIPVYKTSGFWSLVVICSVTFWLLIALCGTAFVFGMFTMSHWLIFTQSKLSHWLIFTQSKCPTFEARLIYLIIATPLILNLVV